MMYVDSYAEWLARCDKDGRGWPKFVDLDAQKWLVERVREVLAARGPLDTMAVYELGWKRVDRSAKPARLRDLALWDAILGVTYRALLEACCEQRWHLPKEYQQP